MSTKVWGRVSVSPLPEEDTIGASILDKICLASVKPYNGYIYNPGEDTYSDILQLPGGDICIGHGYIFTLSCFYVMTNGDPCSWTAMDYKAKDGHCCYCMMNSYVFKKGKYLFFCSCKKILYRFDTEEYVYEKVAEISS